MTYVQGARQRVSGLEVEDRWHTKFINLAGERQGDLK